MEPSAAQRIRAEAKEATRRALLQAGVEETVERGGTIPSIETICARAGYTRGAFYVHFKDRGDFVVQMLEWVIGDIFASLFTRVGGEVAPVGTIIERFMESLATGDFPDVGDIRAAYLGVIDGFRISDRVRLRHAELMTAGIAMLEQSVRDGQATGEVRADVDALAAARLLMVTGIGFIIWDNVGIPLDPRALGGMLVGLLWARPGGES